MTNLPLPFDLLYRYKSSERLVELNKIQKTLILDLHRDLIINSPELIILYAYFTKRRLLEAEHLLVEPKHAYTYVCFIGEQIKSVEPFIANSAEYSYWYARNYLDGHFYLGEPIISKSAYWSFYYATDIIKDRFYLGEPSIYDSEYKIRYIEYFGIKSNTPTPVYYSTPK